MILFPLESVKHYFANYFAVAFFALHAGLVLVSLHADCTLHAHTMLASGQHRIRGYVASCIYGCIYISLSTYDIMRYESEGFGRQVSTLLCVQTAWERVLPGMPPCQLESYDTR